MRKALQWLAAAAVILTVSSVAADAAEEAIPVPGEKLWVTVYWPTQACDQNCQTLKAVLADKEVQAMKGNVWFREYRADHPSYPRVAKFTGNSLPLVVVQDGTTIVYAKSGSGIPKTAVALIASVGKHSKQLVCRLFPRLFNRDGGGCCPRPTPEPEQMPDEEEVAPDNTPEAPIVVEPEDDTMSPGLTFLLVVAGAAAAFYIVVTRGRG